MLTCFQRIDMLKYTVIFHIEIDDRDTRQGLYSLAKPGWWEPVLGP